VSLQLISDNRFKIHVVAKTIDPQQLIWLSAHRDYCEANSVLENPPIYLPKNEKEAGEKLEGMLLNKGHFGPLEHPHITFEVCGFPHDTMVQARTHRVPFCLSEDTEIYFQARKSGPRHEIKKLLLKDLAYNWFHGRRNWDKDPCFIRKRIKNSKLFVFNTATRKTEETNIVDIIDSGIKPVYKVTTFSGHIIKATEDHRFLTWNEERDDYEWKKLKELISKKDFLLRWFIGDPKRVENKHPHFTEEELANEIWKPLQDCEKEGFEVSNLGRVRSVQSGTPVIKAQYISGGYLRFCADTPHRITHVEVLKAFKKPTKTKYQALHRNDNAFDNRLCNLYWGSHKQNIRDRIRNSGGVSCKTARPDRVISIEYVGEEQCYDLEVAHPQHNFFANGLIVHNSFDVQSQRYTGKRVLSVVNFYDSVCSAVNLDPQRHFLYETLTLEERLLLEKLEDLFYVRPVGKYVNRKGNFYEISESDYLRRHFINRLFGAIEYSKLMQKSFAEEDSRCDLPQGLRQSYFMTTNTRGLMHFLDMRYKADAQPEIITKCHHLMSHFSEWSPEIASWYLRKRANKNKVAP